MNQVHCWNYRRFVIKKAGIAPTREIELSTKLIEENFSNFSAWHHRSIFIMEQYKDDHASYKEKILEELDYVKQAFYTEPDDQSAWIYHRWLLSISKKIDSQNHRDVVCNELSACKELLEIEQDSKWTMLTIVFLLLELNDSPAEVQDLVKKLQNVDPMREAYYKDLESKICS